MATEIHPTAIVETGAELGDNVHLGPYSVIGNKVRLGDGVVIDSHVVVSGNTTIGANSHIYPFASLGQNPQIVNYREADTRLVIGANAVIREYVTMSPGTEKGGGITSIGDNCMFMIAAHVAHDCHVGNNVIFTNAATLAGHCEIGDYVILGGLCALHQFVRVGDYAFIGGMAGVENDVIPYGIVLGNRARLGGLNLVGLKRRGFSRDQIHALRRAYRMLFADEGALAERVDQVAETFPDEAAVQKVVAFIRADPKRALCTPREG